MNDTNLGFAGPNVAAARDFTRHLTDLLRKENGALVSFLLALAECDGRRLWAHLGYASLFDYLHREMKLSKSSAWYRAAGAALITRYPAIADALGNGRLCVSTLGEIRKVITPDNASVIVPRFFHCSAREAKEIAAAIAPVAASPRQDLITTIRAVPRMIPTQAAAPIDVVQTSEPAPTARPATRAEAERPPQAEVRPLTAELRRLHVTVTKEWVEKLEAAKAVLSHSIPSGSAEAVLEAALDALLEREAKRKGLLVKAPRIREGAKAASAGTCDGARRAIPAHVRREVLRRDRGECQARLHDGSVCGSRTRVQLDHVIPVALGGPSTVENVRVLCERHNQLAARAVFGERIMDLFARRRP